MLKKNILRANFIVYLTFLFMLIIRPIPVLALKLDKKIRTVLYSYDPEPPVTITLSIGQLKRGKYFFSNACAACHVGGITKPDPNIGLDIQALHKSVPRRNYIFGIVSFLRNPKSYDGRIDISELHPCTRKGYYYPKMRNLTKANLIEIAGYILFEAQILGQRWGGGKIYY